MKFGEFTILPFTTVEEIDVNDEELVSSGLGELAGLDGWGVFKKIGRAFKKVGRGIKKLTFRKVFKVAAPLIAGSLIPGIGALAFGGLSKAFGGRIASLVRKGATHAQALSGGRAALITQAQAAALRQIVPAGSAVSDAIFRKILGPNALGQVIPGATIRNGRIELPVANAPMRISQTTISGRGGFRVTKKTLLIGGAVIGGVALIAMVAKR